MLCVMILVAVLSGLICGALHRKHLIVKHKAIAITILVTYLFFVLCITLSGRVAASYYSYKLQPLWSWRMILRGERKLIAENIWNIVLFVPIGILIPIAVSPNKWIIGLPFALSVFIEVTQLLSKIGLFEFDDIIHNTIGALVGILIYRIIRLFKARVTYTISTVDNTDR